MDDDLLLNFDTSAPVRAPKKERRRPQAQRTPQKRARTEEPESGAPKRARPAGDAPAPKRPAGDDEARRAVAAARRLTGGPPTRGTGYISSLFARDEANADQPAAVPQASALAPSNAPSMDGTFEGLGLSRLLARHLSTRMGLEGKPTEIQRLAIPPMLSSPPMEAAMRDILLQAQTGSGKTLTYLLPIVQSILPLSQESFIDRSVGTLAIILAPTRELARQIYTVLEKVLALSLASDDEDTPRYSRWIVPGLLTGGSTKNHEKQRLRKGCPILVATPGRLLDHLQNTSSLDVGKCRWLVLDEADRLLEMGFEEQLDGIIKALEGRRRLAVRAAKDALVDQGALTGDEDEAQVTDSLGIAWWAWRMRLVLCSATLDERVQAFAGTALHEPILIRAGAPTETEARADDTPTFAAPSQLQQHCVIVPPKLRLVSLVALLRHSIPRTSELAEKGPARVIVFMSSTDGVDFHWQSLGGAKMGQIEQPAEGKEMPLAQYSDLLPNTPIYRLHGSMTQKERIASLRAFRTLTDGTDSTETRRGGVLLCTSVASRGLDLPDVRCVIQMDVPTEGGVEEYVHRVGRTARVGRAGSSWLMLMPHEKPWLTTLTERMVVYPAAHAKPQPARISLVGLDTVLYEGFGGAQREYESRATDVQMALERWVLAAPEHATLARTAFLAHIRAYATHPASEKAIFNVNQLHLGHIAKAYALREAPNTVQKTSKREHDKKENKTESKKDDDARARRQRMMANLPTVSM